MARKLFPEQFFREQDQQSYWIEDNGMINFLCSTEKNHYVTCEIHWYEFIMSKLVPGVFNKIEADVEYLNRYLSNFNISNEKAIINSLYYHFKQIRHVKSSNKKKSRSKLANIEKKTKQEFRKLGSILEEVEESLTA